ncbi:MAG: MFS transporter [Candidatus Omnitrophica bacterium]|nr:MFS transporter [Candidatus Omnitrophota bacterium]
MEDYIITDRSKQNWLMAIVAASVIMFSIDYSMLNISLPSIAKYFNVKLVAVSWIPLVYLLIVTSSVLGFGKLGDLKGFKRVFMMGFAFFLIGTVCCALAPTVSLLIAFRALQSVGEAMFSPIGIALLTALLPEDRRGKALGIVALAQGVGFSLGPVIGGFINSHIGWRGIFCVNIPLGLVTAFLAAKMLPSKQRLSSELKFDLPGAGLIFVALSTLVIAMNSIIRMGFKNPKVLGCFAVSFIAFAFFIIREKRAPYPLLDLKLFRNRDFTFSNAAAFCATCLYMGSYFLFPFYLELVMRLDVSKTGLVLMSTPLMMVIISPIAGKISDRIGSRLLCSLGAGLAIFVYALFSTFTQATGVPLMVFNLLLAGMVMGLFLAPNNKLVLAHAPVERQGVASSVYKIALSVGSVFGIATFPLVLMKVMMLHASRLKVPISEARHMPELLMTGFHAAFIFGIVVSAATLVFSLLAKDKKK